MHGLSDTKLLRNRKGTLACDTHSPNQSILSYYQFSLFLAMDAIDGYKRLICFDYEQRYQNFQKALIKLETASIEFWVHFLFLYSKTLQTLADHSMIRIWQSSF
jgi:hypothetical protein